MKRLIAILSLFGITLAAMAQSSPIVRVNTTAAMVNLPILTTNISVFVTGGSALGDGGGGLFAYKSTATDATNTSTVYAPATGSGRYIAVNKVSWNQFVAVTPADGSTYAYQLLRNLQTNYFGIGADNAYVYLQTFQGKPLQINGVGNDILVNGGGSGNVVLGNTLTVTNATTLQSTVSIGGGATIRAVYSAAGNLDFPSISATSVTNLTITVTGAGTNSTVNVSAADGALSAALGLTAYVSSTNTVTVRAINPTVNAVDPASAAYRVTVFQY